MFFLIFTISKRNNPFITKKSSQRNESNLPSALHNMIIENTTFLIVVMEEIESIFVIASIIKDMKTDKTIQNTFYLRLLGK